MKKIAIFVTSILILSGLSVGIASCEQTEYKKTTLSFSNLQIHEKEDGITLGLTGANSILLLSDHYMVPTRVEIFTFPFGTEIINVKCAPKNIHRQQLTKELIIAPEPILINETNNTITTKKPKNPQSINSWYTYDIGCGLNGNQRNIIVKVEVFPVQYFPSENMVDWAETIKIEVQYNKPRHPLPSYDQEYNLIILTPVGFSDELSSLVTHKIARGVSTKLITLDDIYSGSYFPVQGRDNPEKIKYFIKNAIENWGTTNVILVGGIEEFPARETHIKISDDDQEIFVSDLYYADIYNKSNVFCSWDSNGNDVFAEYNWGDNHNYDKMDLYPDVNIGRLPATSSEDVTTVVNKIITYEDNKAYTQNWFNKIVVIGGDSVPNENDNPDEVDVNEGEFVNQAMLDIMDGFIPDIIWDSNSRLSGFSPNGVQNINDGINSGCGFVDFSGHGAPWIWTTYPHNGKYQTLPTPTGQYTNTIIGTLINGDKLPIVMCGGCSLGKYQANDQCFAWSYLSNPNGGGIASFGATGLGYIYTGKYVTHGLVEGFMVDLYKAYNNGAFTLGEMWSKAINYYLSSRPNEGDYKTLTELHTFGDPTLIIAEESLPPNTPNAPEGPESGKTGTEYTYSAVTTDPEGDQISYLFNWGDGTYSEWTNLKNSGQTASVSHTWQSDGSYQIRVKAKDQHGTQSAWSDPLPITMPYSYNPMLQFLERLSERFPNAFSILRHLVG
jgi:Peptidase family C25/PKD domain